jgi:hypothetical protein
MPSTEPRGPHCYEYLRSFRSGSQTEGGFEFALFGDSYFTGWDAVLGPYHVLNYGAFTDHRPGYFRPCVLVRCSAISAEYRPSFERTDTSRFHGGMLTDEIAALISLILGVRLQAGKVDREFYNFASPGMAIGRELKPWPESRQIGPNPQVVSALRSNQLSQDAFVLLDQFDRIGAREANALVKAARLYQRALWIVEWDVSQAWLLFVSAIEALGRYSRGDETSPLRLLTESHPDLARRITAKIGEQLFQAVAPELEPLLGSVRKFRGFVQENFPSPPAARPQHAPTIIWNFETLGPMLTTIYKHRSQALHDGTPFRYRCVVRRSRSLQETLHARCLSR